MRPITLFDSLNFKFLTYYKIKNRRYALIFFSAFQLKFIARDKTRNFLSPRYEILFLCFQRLTVGVDNMLYNIFFLIFKIADISFLIAP